MLNINSNKSKRKFYWLLIFIFILVFIIIPLALNYFITKSNQNFLSDYFGAVIGAIIGATVSGLIALYATHQQIKANRHDNFINAINFNNYKELNHLLNDAFKEVTSVIKIKSSIAILIKRKEIANPNIGEQLVPKYLLSYSDKSFPEVINFHNSYIMKLQSITGNMSTPIKDLRTFECVIKSHTNDGTNTIYKDIDIISNLNKRILSIISDDDTNETFEYFSKTNEQYFYYDPSNLIKKENNYLKDFKNKVERLLKILTKIINNIQNIRDKNVKALLKR